MSARPVALLAGLAISSPSIYGALVTGTVPTGTATVRTVLVLSAAMIVASWFESMVANYGKRSLLAEVRDDEYGGDPLGSSGRQPVSGVPDQRRRSSDRADDGPRERRGAST